MKSTSSLRYFLALLLIITTFVLGTITGYFYKVAKTPVPKTENLRSRILVLIEEMIEASSSNLLREYWNDSMEELVEIGEPSVPKLIEVLETAEGRSRASYVLGDIKPSEEGIRMETEIIQTRAAMVLGKIGDARALPFLEKLKDKKYFPLYGAVIEAIEKIEKKLKEEK